MSDDDDIRELWKQIEVQRRLHEEAFALEVQPLLRAIQRIKERQSTFVVREFSSSIRTPLLASSAPQDLADRWG